ncbi:MAG: NAD-dependent epimerase/dehydratase family protein [Candidatus Eisenbacteria bacterium]
MHQAALASVQRSVSDPVPTHEVNMTGTLQLLEAAPRAQGVRRFVFAGSSSVYGDQPELPKHEGDAPPRPRSPYALSVVEVVLPALLRALRTRDDLLRYFSMFGPRQAPDSRYAAVIPLFSRAVVQGDAR